MHVFFRTVILFFFFAGVVNAAPAKPATTSPLPLPGQVTQKSGGYEIAFENGRILRWTAGDEINLSDPAGQTLLNVSLKTAAAKESSAEAMGISVEETDLGGVVSSKTYLSGKKKPQGKSFNPSALSDKPVASQADKEQKSQVDGIAVTTVEYPNGASLLRFAWPDAVEEIYFDRKKSMVHSETVRKVGGLTASLKQWSEGSYSRRYLREQAGVAVTYDDNDNSYLYEVFNAQGATIAQLTCREQCSQE